MTYPDLSAVIEKLPDSTHLDDGLRFSVSTTSMGIFPLLLAAIFAWIAYARRAALTDLRTTLSR